MKRFHLLLFFFLTISFKATSQLIFDLADDKITAETVDLTKSILIIKNMLPNQEKYRYSFELKFTEEKIPAFSLNSLAESLCPDNSETKNYITAYAEIKNAKKEESLPGLQKKLEKAITDLDSKYEKCKEQGNALISKLIYAKELSFTIRNNQTITVTVKRTWEASNGKDTSINWTKVFKTPEKSRWLVHYGLTYSPSVLAKTDRFYSLADTSSPNKFTLTKENTKGPVPWDNISATINFTYPMLLNPKGGNDGGFTAGFGISAGFELSGQAGLSFIIGENVILGGGIVMMQRYKLMGKYSEGQIVKENFNFESLHSKVWLPELYFTLGFRFGNNPFAKKAAEPAAKPAETPAEQE